VSASGGSGNSTGGRTATGGGSATGGSSVGSGGGPSATGGVSVGNGGSGEPGSGGVSSSAGAAGGAAGGATVGSTGGAGGNGVLASTGCGMMPPTPMSRIGTTQYGKFVINITAQSVLQFNAMPGMNRAVDRQYYVRLPNNYVNTRPYRVIYLGPGCSPAQDSLTTPIRQPPLDTDTRTTAAQTDAILVQLQQGTYNPAAYNASTCQINNTTGCNASSAYCFDDWASEPGTPMVSAIPDGPMGAIAMEKAYFGAVHTAIENAYCVDRSRQFYAGYSSGGWLAQQLGCWYPGVLRAQANVTGGIPPIINANAMGANSYCVKQPLAYFSIHNNPDPSNPFQGSVDGARRVFALNGCTGAFPGGAAGPPGPTVATIPAGLEVYQVAGVPNNNAFRCYRFTTCPAAYPMYFCVSALTVGQHDAQSATAAPAFWEFFSRF
jgi:hypothetical protein